MTPVERYKRAALIVAQINPGLSVSDVLEKTDEILSVAGPQKRERAVKRTPSRKTNASREAA